MTVWRHRRFRLFWAGDTISAAGGALSTVAIPVLAISSLHASDAAVGAIRAAQTMPFLLLAVPIGLLADRISRRRLLLYADALRVPLVGAIAVAALSVDLLAGLVFLAGVCTVAYEVAYLSALPDLVDNAGELPAANRAVETAHAGATLLGPAVGGTLIVAMSPSGVVALDALSFVIGAALTLVNRWEPGRYAAATPPRSLTAGARWLWRDPLVRPFTLYLAVNNLAAQAFQTALLLFILRTLALPAWTVGVAIAAAGGGFLLGAMISPPIARRLGTGRVVIAASLIGALGIAVVALGPLIAVLVGAFLSGVGSGLFNLHSIAVRQAVTPPALLGRVNAVVKTASYGATTLGALAGGVLAGAAGPRIVIVCAAVVSAAATAVLALSAVRSAR